MKRRKPTRRHLQALRKIKQLERDLDDCYMAAQTIFHRCECGRIAERGIRCPTNQEGGKCEAGS